MVEHFSLQLLPNVAAKVARLTLLTVFQFVSVATQGFTTHLFMFGGTDLCGLESQFKIEKLFVGGNAIQFVIEHDN